MGDQVLVNEITDEIGPVVRGMGFELVDITAGRSHQTTHVQVVIYRNGEMGVNDLASLARAVKARLETLKGFEDLALTVTSPGIDRTIRRPKEYGIFKGKGIRVLPADDGDWIAGVIADFQSMTLSLKTGDEILRIPVSTIKKARLDDSQEV